VLGFNFNTSNIDSFRWPEIVDAEINEQFGHPYFIPGEVEQHPSDELAHRYIIALYFVISLLTTLGMQFLPANIFEIFFHLFMLLCNMTLYAFAVGKISALVMRQDDEIVDKRAQLTRVQVYLSHLRLPAQLRRQIELFFLARLKDASISSFSDEVIYDLLPVALQRMVSQVTNRLMVGELSLLRGCDEAFIDRLSSLLRERAVESEVYLFRAGDVCKELFIVNTGLIEVINGDSEARDDAQAGASTCEHGDTIGDIAFVFKIRHFNSARSVGKGDSGLFVLTLDRYSALVKMFPLQEDHIADNVMADQSGAAMGGVSTARSGASKASSMLSAGTGKSSNYLRESLNGIQKIIADHKKKRTDHQARSLCAACAKGDVEALRLLMAVEDLDLDAGDYDNRRPIHLAACTGNLVAIQMLTAARADVNVRDRMGSTPLHDALVHKQGDAAKLLISVGAQRLFPQIADRMCYVASLPDGDEELKYLVQYENMFVSAVNHDGRTALHLAASNGNIENARLLLENGAAVNASDAYGATPLQDAFRFGHKATAKLLVEHGGHMGKFDAGIRFCMAGNSNDVKLLGDLIGLGCDPNLGDYDGRTALHLAASNGNIEAVIFLLKQKQLNILAEDRYGNTAYDDALRETGGDVEVVCTMLAKRGGRPGSHSSTNASLVSAMGAEEELVRISRANVQREEEIVPAVLGFTAFVAAASRQTREMRKLLVEIRVFEREDARISEAKPHFWTALQGFSRWYQAVVASELLVLQAIAASWHAELELLSATGPMQQHLMALLQLKADSWHNLDRVLEATFDGRKVDNHAHAHADRPSLVFAGLLPRSFAEAAKLATPAVKPSAAAVGRAISAFKRLSKSATPAGAPPAKKAADEAASLDADLHAGGQPVRENPPPASRDPGASVYETTRYALRLQP